MTKNRLTLPLVPLRGMTVFPGMTLHFDVGRPRSIAAVRRAMDTDKYIFLCYQTDIAVDQPQAKDLAQIGTIAEIRQILNLPDGNIRVLINGLDRGKITRFTELDQLVEVNVTRLEDIPASDDIQIQVLVRRMYHLVEEFLSLYDRLSPEAMTSLLSIENPGELTDVVISNFPVKAQLKQEILDEISVEARLKKLIAIISHEIDILKIEKELADKVQESLDENQREYVLREKLKVIQEELGDGASAEDDAQKYRKQVNSRQLPQEVADKLNEEITRLTKTHPYSQEYGVVQNYIETVLALPWDHKTEDRLDLETAKAILERDHYGLQKVKERILEYIAVRKLSGQPKNNILCLVGPPGTGKTSIARSLAEALGRNYIRISLGGVQNESEIRGHRKTYVGAMPGRIIDALKRAGSSNPLMLFDEIDKMSHSYNGDPASAMLEVFDPEQNQSFRDHYIELPFDLSGVLFVATANSLDTVPKPLLDRMDIMEISGYTMDEKMNIAKKYLIPKQRRMHGLKASQLKFNASALPALIESYTRESGVRSLERRIAAICRKAAVKTVEDSAEGPISVTAKNLSEFLGKPIYHYDKTAAQDQIGLVNGLAWTESGGDTLSIEVNTMSGTGKLELTGNLGDVMQESAKAALSFVRANAFRLGIAQDFYKKLDIHIHVPEGAVPKDGPSAGITMATALVSALSGRPVNRLVAMTGEITLRGRVLPIGGLKEKALAAFRMGIKTIVLPFDNKPDYEELPQNLKDSISFVFAKDMNTVLKTALLPVSTAKKQPLQKEVRYIDALISGSEQKERVRADHFQQI
ncbi:endopeptidase La [Ructibacterium gallinarum]|uniref:Lon protease n=1 Tax=Ructibacterium gallinarum TaxID=2779355 RepID=A0A9D5LYJ1_9FIRM|nr:endopeptidase La [Ructibacterium gallinarum]MBE5038865.1 endopeptidase La [Ructibacterium gallinarum]